MLRRPDPLQLYADVGGQALVDAIKACERVTEQYNSRYLVKRRPSASWRQVGAVRQIMRQERGARFECEHGWVELYWSAPSLVRVRLHSRDNHFESPASTLVKRDALGAVTLEFQEADEALEIRSTALVCHVNKQSFSLRLELLPDRRLVCEDAAGMEIGDAGDVRLTLALPLDESCYGLGMRAARLNLRGRRLHLWNADPGSYRLDSDPLYYSIPFYLGVKDGAAYGILWDNPSRGTVDLAAELAFTAVAGELRYYVIAAADAAGVATQHSELVGRAELPPLWALGYGHAQFSYASLEELPRLAAEFRAHGVPCEALCLDLKQTTIGQVALSALVAELHTLGFKVIAPVIPGVDESFGVDLLLRYPDGEPVVGATWLGLSACFFPDFGLSVAQTRWQERIALLVDSGVDGLLLDMAEPTVLGGSGVPETLPDYVEQQGGTHGVLHNLYAAQMTQATEAALKALLPEQRPVIFTRSGYGGTAGLVWTGANEASWEHLRLSIPMILNISLSGITLDGANVGGYYGQADAELYTRWLQAACLLPVLRADNFEHTPVPWGFGQPYELINRLTLDLRARLLPYLYSLIALNREYGLPVVRPLFMAGAMLSEVDDAYLVGDLLVAPVLEKGSTGRAVHLPRGLWYDYWTNEAIPGGQVISVTAPLERLPLFVRSGAALPEQNGDRLILHVYPGDGETVLYEDSGVGRDAEQGNYRWVYITCAWDEDVRFFVSRRTAGRFEPGYKVIRVEILGVADEPLEVRLDRQAAPLWYYDEGVVELTADDSFHRIEIVRRAAPTDRTLTHRPG